LGHAVQDLKHNIKHPDQPKQIDLNRIGVLWSTFSTKPFDKDYATSTAPKLDNNVADIRIGNYSNLSRRWACLMLLVRLLQMRAEATRFVTQFDERLNDTDKRILGAELQEYDVYLSWFPVSQGPVDLDKITSRGWKAVLDRNVDHPTEMGVSLNIGDLLHGRAWQVDAEGNGTYGLKPGERELLHWYALSLTPKFQRRDWDQQACRVLLGGA